MTGKGLRILKVFLFSTLALLLFGGAPLQGKVIRVVVERREDLLGGRSWGEAGVYEKLVGRIFFVFDPDNPANARVVDLAWAPRNGDGMVEAWADFMVLQPKDPGARRGTGWLEVSNRGGKASLRYFDRATGDNLDPSDEADFGDGLLLRAGLTIIWVGWQWDVPDGEDLLRLHVPVARLPGGVIQGLVRADWTVDEDADVLELGHRRHRAYLPISPRGNGEFLTVREGRLGDREVIDRERWHFVEPDQEGRDYGIALEGGFKSGSIYELVYLSRDPRVVGLGLAAVRDVISYAKYELDSLFPVTRGVAFGVSQTGRFLRHFLYQGFNVDEGGRRAFDGMLIHTAGAGRGSFNHRFAQPSRDGHRYSAFFYPTDLFPFTSRTQTDPVTGVQDGLFQNQDPEALPRVFYTNTGYEYWGRAGSLIHTSVDGTQDVEPMANERIYHLAGGQHFVGRFPPDGPIMDQETLPVYRGNPVNFLFTLRSLAFQLLGWVEEGEEPPPSRFPHLSAGTLVHPEGLAFPPLPGVRTPLVIHEAYRADYGPRWREEGIASRQPPALGPPFPSLVSQVDGLGNEMAGIRGVELRVPVATYTPWSLRWGYGSAQGELVDFLGTFIPLSRTEAERDARSDPRPSVEALYGTRDTYLEHVRAATRALVRDGFLLPEDAPLAAEAAEEKWNWVMGGGRQGTSEEVTSGAAAHSRIR
jgi:hypothetical protein